jgi:hypothetical protein
MEPARFAVIAHREPQLGECNLRSDARQVLAPRLGRIHIDGVGTKDRQPAMEGRCADVGGGTDPIDETDSMQDAEPVLHRALGPGGDAHELARGEHLVLAEEPQELRVGRR